MSVEDNRTVITDLEDTTGWTNGGDVGDGGDGGDGGDVGDVGDDDAFCEGTGAITWKADVPTGSITIAPYELPTVACPVHGKKSHHFTMTVDQWELETCARCYFEWIGDVLRQRGAPVKVTDGAK